MVCIFFLDLTGIKFKINSVCNSNDSTILLHGHPPSSKFHLTQPIVVCWISMQLLMSLDFKGNSTAMVQVVYYNRIIGDVSRINESPLQIHYSLFKITIFCYLQFVKQKKSVQPGTIFTIYVLFLFFYLRYTRCKKKNIHIFTLFTNIKI